MRINTFTTYKNSLIRINAQNTHNNYHKRHKAKYIIIKIINYLKIKKNFFLSLHNIKMDQKKVMFFEKHDKSYTMVDLYINNRFLGYKNSYNYYDTDVDKILLFKKSDNEYVIRYNDVNRIVPLQIEINNSYKKINAFKKNNNKVMFIYNDDKEFFRKGIDLWDKIIELIGINNHIHFVKADENDELFVMANIHKNTSFVIEDSYRYGNDKDVIVLHSIINDCIKTSLVQHIY